MVKRYLSHQEFFGRLEEEYPPSENIIKSGPGPEHVTIYDVTGKYEKLVLSIDEILQGNEALGFSWKG